MKSILIVPSKLDIELNGAREMRVEVGSRVKLLPHCDLWARGAHYAVVRKIGVDSFGSVVLHVRPEITGVSVRGALHAILPDHVDTGRANG